MKKTNILVVEDDPIVGAVLTAWAQHEGAVVTLVGGIAEADAALDTGLFDLILSDVNMPGNNGLRWTETVLLRPLSPPVILITGNPELETTLRAANLPVAGYLVKPPDFTLLTQLSRRCVREHQRRRELQALSSAASRLLAHSGAEAEPLRAQLLQLSSYLEAGGDRTPRSPVTGWHAAIADTIATLEKTKDSFRSKELGRLRQRLQSFLGQSAA